MEFKKTKTGAIVPKRSTKSWLAYVSESTSNDHLILLIQLGFTYLAQNPEEIRGFMIDSLGKAPKTDPLLNFYKTADMKEYLDLKNYDYYLGQMTYTRIVDNVTTYFKDILAEVIIAKPRLLKSAESEKLDFILNYETMEELQAALAEKKIEELFYKGINDIESYFDKRLGISLFKTKDDKIRFNAAVKQRNLIVHNRGRVSKQFVREFPGSKFKVNDTFTFSLDKLSQNILFFNNYLAKLDNEIAEKFDLKMLKNY